MTLPGPELRHYHQGHHQGGAGLLQPKVGLNSGGKPPPPLIRWKRAPLI